MRARPSTSPIAKPGRGWIVPAYRFVGLGGVPQFGFWCPWCRCVHSHGDVDGLIEHRVHHCHATTSPFVRDLGYHVFKVGFLSSPQYIPKLTSAELFALSELLAPVIAAREATDTAANNRATKEMTTCTRTAIPAKN